MARNGLIIKRRMPRVVGIKKFEADINRLRGVVVAIKKQVRSNHGVGVEGALKYVHAAQNILDDLEPRFRRGTYDKWD